MMRLDELADLVERGDIDTVLVVFTDMQGRLQGKRVFARYFLDEVAHHGTEGCNYLLAVDVEMNTVPGYTISSWDRGYGDMLLQPDLDTLRLVPWMPATAMVQCDLAWLDGSPLRQSPRQILRTQVEAARDRGFVALAGTELEFMVFADDYVTAWHKGYRDLVPANRYNVDYSILGTSEVETLLRAIRNGMAGAGMQVESAKGECNFGQHEIAFRYADVLRTADNHVVYKTGAKEIAATHGKSITFMAKFNEREGNSCHIHMSLRGTDGSVVFADGPHGRSSIFEHFVAGVLDTLAEFTLWYAPNINSYKRYQPGSFAPTTIAWGLDNRTCALRVVGHGPSLRVENRVPGGDVNPYLALAAMLAGGLYGIEHQLPLEPPYEGNAYAANKPHVPTTLRDARNAFAASERARKIFGDDVVDHYVHAADTE
ncbi:MAG: glutamine synthetase, partial [Acidothermus sp.]|nr:glutamine synthetase [Acidothermus sp.]